MARAERVAQPERPELQQVLQRVVLPYWLFLRILKQQLSTMRACVSVKLFDRKGITVKPSGASGFIVGEFMRQINGFVRTIVFIWMAAMSAGAWAAGGYLYDISGSVSIAVGKNAPRPAVKNDAVASGMVIRTGDKSSAVLKFADGQVVSMQANTTFQVREYIYEPKKAEESSVLFSMFRGGMRFITGEIGKRNKNAFRLATPHTTIGIRGTEFMIVMANNTTYGQVISGSISMTNAAGITLVSAGQTVVTSSASTLASTVPATSLPAGTFSQVAAIPVPPATPAPVPTPTPAPAPAGAAVSTGSTTAAAGSTTTAGAAATTTATTAGGAAAGGAAASTAATGGFIGGLSATTVGIGVGVAAVAAAVINSSTTHH